MILNGIIRILVLILRLSYHAMKWCLFVCAHVILNYFSCRRISADTSLWIDVVRPGHQHWALISVDSVLLRIMLFNLWVLRLIYFRLKINNFPYMLFLLWISFRMDIVHCLPRILVKLASSQILTCLVLKHYRTLCLKALHDINIFLI